MKGHPAFDGKRGYWLRQLSDCAEASFGELCDTLVEYGGSSPALYAKVADGNTWQGDIDPKTPLWSFDGLAALWTLCKDKGVAFAPVVVPRGDQGESFFHGAIAAQCSCLIVDIEAGMGFYPATRTPEIPGYWAQLRVNAPNAFLVSQPDPRNLESVYTADSIAYIDAFSAQHYVGWTDVGWTDVVREVKSFDTIRQYQKPSYPILYGVGNADIVSTFWRAIRDYSLGFSLFRLGVMGPREFQWTAALKLPGEAV